MKIGTQVNVSVFKIDLISMKQMLNHLSLVIGHHWKNIWEKNNSLSM